MAGNLQPLDEKFVIVGPDGRPTLYFIEWCQQRQIDIVGAITAEQFTTLLTEYLLTHQLQEGDGIALTPSGNLNDSPEISVRNGTGLDFDGMQNLKIADTAVTPGTYGDATHVPQLTVDQQGRITDVVDVAISGGGGGGGGYFNGYTGGIGGTDTAAFATKGHHYTPSVDIEVHAIFCVLVPSAGGQAHHGQIASVDPSTGTIGTVVGSTNTVNSISTGTLWYRFEFATPVTLTAGTTYLIAVVNASGAGTTAVRVAGVTSAIMNAPGAEPLNLSKQLRYNTIDVSNGQAVSSTTANTGFNIGIEGYTA